MSGFDEFCIHHQRSIPVVVLIGVVVSTWYIFYGTVGSKGRKWLCLLLTIASIITLYGAWTVYHEYHELPGYLLSAGLPFVVVVATGAVKIKFDIAHAFIRPVMAMLYFLGASWYSFCLLSWLTPVFALVNWGTIK